MTYDNQSQKLFRIWCDTYSGESIPYLSEKLSFLITAKADAFPRLGKGGKEAMNSQISAVVSLLDYPPSMFA